MRFALALSAALALASPALAQSQTVTGSAGTTVTLTPLESFEDTWSMAALPDGRMVVAEQTGDLWLVGTDGKIAGPITGGPTVEARGQGGFADIILDPDFARNNRVFISWVERDADNDSRSGGVVERATLRLSRDGGRLTNRQRLWEQSPKVRGNGHYALRLAVSPDNAEGGGGFLFITSGERQKFTPAQNMDMNLGKVVRLNRDGSVPDDNPFAGQGGVTKQIWTLGQRNPLGIDFAADGTLWVHEMGPAHGDELNRIVRSENYGYPEVSNGDHYSGKEIPDHSTNPIYENPAAYWDPAISPAGFAIYKSDVMPEFTGDGFIGGLSSQALIRVVFDREKIDNVGGSPSKTDMRETIAAEAERFEWGKRIRDVEQGADGALYVLEDGEGRLVRVTLAD